MAVNLTEMAQKMAQAARKGVAIEKKRLKKILAERQKQTASSSRDSSYFDFHCRSKRFRQDNVDPLELRTLQRDSASRS